MVTRPSGSLASSPTATGAELGGESAVCGVSAVRRRDGAPEAAILRFVVSLSFAPKDRVFFDLLSESGRNAVRAADLLQEMIKTWPDGAEGLNREILKAEQEGDRITHDNIRRINSTCLTPFAREVIYGLASTVDDVVDYIEEAGDFLGLYQIEAPMQQAIALADVLVGCCGELSTALDGLRGFKDLDSHLIEIHRLENDGDRISRDAVASLFANGIDPMVVIRWKDIFAVLERAIDATETCAHIIEGVAIKNA
jgi:uncharacterized protein Yka (UPF0111/DUF47 family)